MRGSGKKGILFLVGITGRKGVFLQQQQHEVGVGFSGSKCGRGFRQAKNGSFSSAGVLLARDDDNGRKKLILIKPASSKRTGYRLDRRFKRSDPGSIPFRSNWPDRTKTVTGRRSDRTRTVTSRRSDRPIRYSF